MSKESDNNEFGIGTELQLSDRLTSVSRVLTPRAPIGQRPRGRRPYLTKTSQHETNSMSADEPTASSSLRQSNFCMKNCILNASNQMEQGMYQFSLWNKAMKRPIMPQAVNSHDTVSSSLSSAEEKALEKARTRRFNVDITRSMSPRKDTCLYAESVCEAQSLMSPLSIAQYKRGMLIGEGTFGKVYVSLDCDTGELVAVKEIRVKTRADSEHSDPLRQLHKLGEEISLMENLHHRHIVRYKGSIRSEKTFYIFMEYVPGGSIASMLKQFDAFSEPLLRKFMRQIVEGVAYLHQMGIVHRDIKGANVLVNEQGVAKLADFGCSKQLTDIQSSSLEESLRSIRGSVPWMAPEVVKQSGHDYKADIWSVGATMIEMATAKLPWPDSTNSWATMLAIANASEPPPCPETLSDEAKQFLQGCMRIDPEERYTAEMLLSHPFLMQKNGDDT